MNAPFVPQTAIIRQYEAIRAEHPGVLVAMRVGDFYEFYGEDATTAAGALEIVLTGKEDGSNGRIPMAGVPHHSIERYLARLLKAGHRVALAEQMEDPKKAKGLVKRGVARILTPGTLVEDSFLGDPGESRFLAALCVQNGTMGLATLDPSTGEFAVTELSGERAAEHLLAELARLRPAELLHDGTAPVPDGLPTVDAKTERPEAAARRLMEGLRTASLDGFGVGDRPAMIAAAAMVLAYAEGNRLPLDHVDGLATYSVDGFMRLDPATRRALELTANLADGTRRFTLLSVLDETVTPMGARLLRRRIEQPLLDREALDARLDAVGRFVNQAIARGDVRDALKRIGDVERLVARCATGVAGPRDLGALRQSLNTLPDLAEPLWRVGEGLIQEAREAIGDHADLARDLGRALVDELPGSLRDGGVIRDGWDPELDAIRRAAREGRGFIAGLESAERERTGISTLKVGFNSVFGYFIEIGKAHVAKVPADYVRKQTTAGAERYITADLKEHETRVLGADEKSAALEAELFARLRARVAREAPALLRTARALAEIDATAALAEVAVRRRYVRPTLTDEDATDLVAARHPVVEAATTDFVPNDTALGDVRLIVLTGPNMAGKSTWLRQNALVQLMAQIGSYVPAESARIGLADRIFARIGAKDDIALGQSTFMVEMTESANILHHATRRSLVILDEVGRGTSTYDGLAIAWAMVEHLAAVGARTLFATHYHQLNALATELTGVANYRVAVREVGDSVVWTHRVLPGGTDRSYGVQVARMAGVPGPVLRRAEEVLRDLEGRDCAPEVRTSRATLQLSLFEAEESPVERELRGLDLENLTPLDALRKLDELRTRVRTRPAG